MVDLGIDHCQACHESTGDEYTVSLNTGDGSGKELSINLCRDCASDLDGQDLVAHDSPTWDISSHGLDESDGVSRESSARTEDGRTGRLFRRAVEAAGHSIYFTDRNGVIEYVNPAFEEITGYTAEEALGKTPTILQSGEHDDAFYERLWETILAGDTWHNEIINETKSGERYVVDQTIAPLENGAGEIEHFVAINVDVTQQFEYEQTISEQNDRLSEFASVVSHDLRNPLNVAQGRLELARDECESEHLQEVARAHGRMNDLIEDLITLSREGEIAGDFAQVDLASLAERCWRNVTTADASITVDVERTIYADESRLKQLMENLVRNAIKHAGSDVTVTVGELENGFYVADDGPGVPESERTEVFDAGFTTEADGTGLGLSIVKQVADAHGWEVRVIDASEGGARFEITGVEFAPE